MNAKDISNNLALAEYYFRKNKTLFAKSLLSGIISYDQTNSKAHELLGYIYGNEGNLTSAYNHLSKACSQKNASPEALYYLGQHLFNHQNYKEAKKLFLNAIKKSGEFYEALYSLGITCANLSDFYESLDYFNKALNLQSNNPNLLFNIARVYDELEMHEKASEYYDSAIKLNSEYYQAWSNKGIILNKLKLYNEALISLDKAILINPNYPAAWLNKGITLNNLKLYNEALTSFDKAILINPKYPEAWLNKGITLNNLKLYNEALASLDKAILINPNYSEAWLNKGITLCNIREYTSAKECYDNAIKINNKYFEAIGNRALVNLRLENYAQGWQDYKTRLDVINFTYPLPRESVPIWDGQKKFKNLLIIGDQGLGDQIFFSKILKKIPTNFCGVFVLTDNRLINIFKRSFPNMIFFGDIESYPASFFDYQITFGDLVAILNLEPSQTIQKPHLTPNLEITNHLRKKYLFSKKITCGISWKSSNIKIGSSKSINLSDLGEMLSISNCMFTNLQYGKVHQEIMKVEKQYSTNLLNIDDIDIYSDIDSLLSIIECCDVIVTTSNINAHLAGAIGKKTLLLTPYSHGNIWYWGDDSQNKWYPSIKQFFQSKDLSWNFAIDLVTKELDAMIRAKQSLR